MELIFIVILAIIASVLIYINIHEEYSTVDSLVLNFGIFISGVLVGVLIPGREPSAIDVYRGKTQLQITETTSSGKVIQRDSTVVYK